MIEQIEQRAGGVARAYTLLGVSKISWHEYKRGERVMPLYIERSIRAHLALSDEAFDKLNRRHP